MMTSIILEIVHSHVRSVDVVEIPEDMMVKVNCFKRNNDDNKVNGLAVMFIRLA
jgi:hypothetical protein